MDGGIMEIIQFWVNVPGKNKMVPPTYTPLSEKDTPKVVDDERVKVSLIAGTIDGITGNIQTFSPLLVLRLDLRKSGAYEFEVPEKFNTLSYQLDGVVKVNKETEMRGKQMAIFSSDSGWISFEALEDTRLIVLSGAPIGEPVVAQGPFVMNTDTQILQAIRDYQMGKMGMLIEAFD
jgi:redox-sensitive bicupin YhaK (pirin superfamily)